MIRSPISIRRWLKDSLLTLASSSALYVLWSDPTAEDRLLWLGYMFLMVMGNMALPTATCVLLFLLARQRLAGPKWMPFALSALVAATGTGLFFAADLLLFQPDTETASNLFSRDYLGWLRWIGIATILLPIHDWWANK